MCFDDRSGVWELPSSFPIFVECQTPMDFREQEQEEKFIFYLTDCTENHLDRGMSWEEQRQELIVINAGFSICTASECV